jgi:hypothetical protein
MIDIEAKFIGTKTEKKMVMRKNKSTGEKVEDFEEFKTLTIAMKKIKYDNDENIKEGTNDPWMRINVSSFDPNAFAEYAEAKMGDTVVVTIDRVE